MSGPPAQPLQDVPPHRRAIVWTWVAVILVGHAVAFLHSAEYWPFSRYTLYSKLYKSEPFETRMLYGVTEDGGEVRLDYRYFLPMDAGRLTRVVRSSLRDSRPADQYRRDMLAWVDVYEHKRTGGWHDGPELVGIRLYLERYFPVADVSNRHQADERELLAQAFVDGVEPLPIPPDVLRRGLGWDGETWVGRHVIPAARADGGGPAADALQEEID